MRLTGLVVMAALSVLPWRTAGACEGSQVLFEDSFESLEPTWGTPDDSFFIDSERLTIMPGYDQYYSALNTMGTYEDADICVDLEAIKADAQGNSFAGLIFWAIDYDNYYYLVVTAEQSIGVFRRQRGRVLPQLRWTRIDALKPGNGVVNQIRVVTAGNTASIYVNGEFYATMKGQPPADGQQIGVRATSPRNDRAIWAVDNMKITVPEAPATQ
ncbi:MAG: hypothetical protein KDK07_07655 [Bauldia sp.]|nr:hypothetical protein [Bauldia sp.]